jgi:hypothetical protein
MVIVADTVSSLKCFVQKSGLRGVAAAMVLRMAVMFTSTGRRASCSAAAGAIASDSVHRGEVTRHLARPRWRKHDLNGPLRKALLARESKRGTFVFIVDATLVSQAGQKTENTYSTGNRGKRRAKKPRYGQKKVVYKKCHSFTFGLLICPSGIRIPMEIPHYTKEYCAAYSHEHRTTAEAAADMIRSLPLPQNAKVVVLGDTAYDAEVIRKACEERGYTWIFPANPERVYEGRKGQRPKLRSRLKDWEHLSPKRIRLHMSSGKYASLRRLSKWRMGPKQKPREYFAYQEIREVRSVGRVQLVFSTMKPHLTQATPDDVKILMTNAVHLGVRDVIELYSLRWQIELFFKELKSTLGFAQYSFQRFAAVHSWVETAITTVLYLEDQRIQHVRDRHLPKKKRDWWAVQRLHGLCAAFRQECQVKELKYMRDRLKTPGGIAKLQRVLTNAIPAEYRAAL